MKETDPRVESPYRTGLGKGSAEKVTVRVGREKTASDNIMQMTT